MDDTHDGVAFKCDVKELLLAHFCLFLVRLINKHSVLKWMKNVEKGAVYRIASLVICKLLSLTSCDSALDVDTTEPNNSVKQ